MIFLAKGHCYLGRRRIDESGNVVKESAARFETDPEGGCVAVGVVDDDTMEQVGQAEVFGDYDQAGYLACALRFLTPSRAGNIPDFEGIIKKMYEESGNEMCPLGYYCERGRCDECIVQRWTVEVDAG